MSYSVGAYRNSYGRASIAATAGYSFLQRGDLDLSVFGGVALYPKDGRNFAVHAGDFVPIGGLQARYRNAFMQVIPSDGLSTDAIVSFGVTFPAK